MTWNNWLAQPAAWLAIPSCPLALPGWQGSCHPLPLFLYSASKWPLKAVLVLLFMFPTYTHFPFDSPLRQCQPLQQLPYAKRLDSWIWMNWDHCCATSKPWRPKAGGYSSVIRVCKLEALRSPALQNTQRSSRNVDPDLWHPTPSLPGCLDSTHNSVIQFKCCHLLRGSMSQCHHTLCSHRLSVILVPTLAFPTYFKAIILFTSCLNPVSFRTSASLWC